MARRSEASRPRHQACGRELTNTMIAARIIAIRNAMTQLPVTPLSGRPSPTFVAACRASAR
jgi:hypothetical protein